MNSLEASEIITRIAHIDWYYNYSDDYSVWKKGSEETTAFKNFVSSRIWSDDDIDTLRLAARNMIMLDTRRLSDQQREDSIQSWNKRIQKLFVEGKDNCD